MEPLGVYRIFERSSEMRKLQYVNFFGDGDSKGYASVKDIYGGYMAVIQFNKGFHGLIDILKHFGVTVGVLTSKGFSELDEIRKTDSKRHSLTVAKVARKKKNRLAKKKKKNIKNELIEGENKIFISSCIHSEGRKIRSWYLPFRTNARTLPITPKRMASRDVGTSSTDITPPHAPLPVFR
ncbi:hypothetical protein TNCV_3046571 [Trichonephila clavipes]|uniref:Uncharacterized protein n=1 Tax=Trichonephila clavipes TaxID=2585209 RepID=A0A8X6RR88_TRICX|nr:hypothetical protein TNCV_3046571 [Trichonephila clavipes]